MCKITTNLEEMRRPGLLVRAANHGVAHYERRRDLRRMLRIAVPATAKAALERLIPIEAELEQRRVTHGKTYSLTRHVDILAALVAEARAFRTAQG